MKKNMHTGQSQSSYYFRCFLVFILAGAFLLFFPGCSRGKESEQYRYVGERTRGTTRVLESRLAGSWYTDDKQALKKQLLEYMKEAEMPVKKDICALILPHAGYQYSGKIAASGVAQLRGNHYTRVIILGPTHRYSMPNIINVPPYTHYKTPLGEIELDTGFIKKLAGSSFVTMNARIHENEHSVQIELPLLQVALGDFLLVPVIVGQLNTFIASEAAQRLLSLMDEKTLVVVSSDFCHYGPDYSYLPFTEDIEENIHRLDMEALDFIQGKDMYGFAAYLERTQTTICGRHPISILLAMINEQITIQPGAYATSGAVTGDFTNSVSYVSVVFSGVWDKKGNPAVNQDMIELSEQDKKNLLVLARRTLACYLEEKKPPDPGNPGIVITSAMKQVMGGFVTLHKNSALRGCIGEIFPRRPLYQVIMDQAVNAGVNDSRFMPVGEEELPDLEFEISALTPPHPVSSYTEIIPGKHGIVLSRDGHSAVFLPQVATEQGWDLETTLSRLARKAGLPGDAWKKGAQFLIFEAVVFSEDDV